MRRILLTLFLGLVILGSGVLGCHKPVVREKPLPDPLLTSKKPIEGRSYFQDALPEKHEELPPPPPPPIPVPGSAAPESVVHMLHVPGK